MELVDDDASVFFFPFPDFFQEGFSAQIVAAPARCLFEVFFHHVAARPLHLDIKALELPLKGIQPLQGGAPVLLRGCFGAA